MKVLRKNEGDSDFAFNLFLLLTVIALSIVFGTQCRGQVLKQIDAKAGQMLNLTSDIPALWVPMRPLVMPITTYQAFDGLDEEVLKPIEAPVTSAKVMPAVKVNYGVFFTVPKDGAIIDAWSNGPQQLPKFVRYDVRVKPDDGGDDDDDDDDDDGGGSDIDKVPPDKFDNVGKRSYQYGMKLDSTARAAAQDVGKAYRQLVLAMQDVSQGILSINDENRWIQTNVPFKGNWDLWKQPIVADLQARQLTRDDRMSYYVAIAEGLKYVK